MLPYRLHSFIGPNGAGKTTFFNMLTGLLKPNAGAIIFDGHDITALPVHRRIRLGLRRSFQILSVFPNLTAFENVRVAVQAQDRRSWGLWRDAYRYDDLNARTWSLLAAVGLDDRAAEPCATSPTASSGCWKSPSRSRPMRNCCCWMSLWPASPKPTARWSAR